MIDGSFGICFLGSLWKILESVSFFFKKDGPCLLINMLLFNNQTAENTSKRKVPGILESFFENELQLIELQVDPSMINS